MFKEVLKFIAYTIAYLCATFVAGHLLSGWYGDRVVEILDNIDMLEKSKN